MRSKTPIFITLGLLAMACLPGCNYVHFGRTDLPATSDSALVGENTDLRLEKKILQQELVIARKEGDALRDTLRNSSAASIGNQTALAVRLQEAAKELGTLRANNARLQVERDQLKNASRSAQNNFAVSQEIADLRNQLNLTEGKLAQTVQDYAKFEQENAELRREVSRVRNENTKLEYQVQSLTLQNEQAIAALSQLNTELIAQKTARQRAEESARATQAQLQLVTDKQPTETTSSLTDTRQSSAAEARDLDATLRIATPTETTGAPTAVLRTSPTRLQNVAGQQGGGKRYHIVIAGETLASLAQKYYGKPNLWRLIYVANNSQLAGGRGLKPGMKLEIPKR